MRFYQYQFFKLVAFSICFSLLIPAKTQPSLPKGIYITMNGKIFEWDNVKKNKELGLFETLK